MPNWLDQFVSAEAGQRRRAWLDDLDARVTNALRYYGGPGSVGVIDALNTAAQVSDAQDYADYTQASRDIWDSEGWWDTVGDAGALATAGAAVLLPGISNRLLTGFTDTVDDLVGAYDPNTLNMGIRAYHGSPHDFDRFSMDHIGTGEGAQAYGHGLYFAEEPSVARQYRERLSAQSVDDVYPDAEAIAKYKPQWDEVLARRDAEIGPAPLNGRAVEWQAWSAADDAYQGELDALTKLMTDETLERTPSKLHGRLYEVNIHADPDDFLDWDAPLSEQSPNVQEALEALDPDMYGKSGGDYDPFETGQMVYHRLQNDARGYGIDSGNAQLTTMGGSQNKATNDIAGFGIPGIKYYDGNSRADGTGTRNYVVFDENLIEIVRKYGVAGAAIMLGVSQAEIEQGMQQ